MMAVQLQTRHIKCNLSKRSSHYERAGALTLQRYRRAAAMFIHWEVDIRQATSAAIIAAIACNKGKF